MLKKVLNSRVIGTSTKVHLLNAKGTTHNGVYEGDAVASWLVNSTPDRVVRVQVLAGDIVLCSWARHSTLTVPLSTLVY